MVERRKSDESMTPICASGYTFLAEVVVVELAAVGRQRFVLSSSRNAEMNGINDWSPPMTANKEQMQSEGVK